MKAKSAPAKKSARAKAKATVSAASVLDELEHLGTKKTREGFARYGITAEKAFGVAMGAIQALAKRVGKDHALAADLWKSGWYEARLLAAFVDEVELVTIAQMDRWARDFDNWGVVDTIAFVLFDKSSHAHSRIVAWAESDREFTKRAAFALLASVALHDKTSGDKSFLPYLPIIEAGAADERNFVKKGVSWALRSVGHRSAALHAASVALAKRLAASSGAGERFVGKDALRDLTRPQVEARLAAKR